MWFGTRTFPLPPFLPPFDLIQGFCTGKFAPFPPWLTEGLVVLDGLGVLSFLAIIGSKVKDTR
jgi:hypothetical protein